MAKGNHQERLGMTLATSIAGEDVYEGDFVTVTQRTIEVPLGLGRLVATNRTARPAATHSSGRRNTTQGDRDLPAVCLRPPAQ